MANVFRAFAILGIFLVSAGIWQTYYIADIGNAELRIPVVTRPVSRNLLESEVRINTTKIRRGRKRPDDATIPDVIKLKLDDFTGSADNLDAGETTKHDDEQSAANQLVPGIVPSIVHFIWCGDKWFEFKHYLSIQSVIRSVNPDRIVIHYDELPIVDKLYYYQWFYNLQHDFPFLHLVPLAKQEMVVCAPGDPVGRRDIILDFLKEDGGMFVGENTWLINFPAKYRDVDFDMSLEDASDDGYVILRKDVLVDSLSVEQVLNDTTLRTRHSTCATVSQFYNVYHSVRCLIVKGGRYDHFLPMHIWNSDDLFVRLCRKIFYGTERVLKPKPSYDELVPNIGHMIWLGGGKMDYVFYLSALSMLYVLKVDNLYIHGDQPPKGPYWEKLLMHKGVNFITRPQPRMIYQGEVEWYYKALMSDIIRVDIMIKYGGIYSDTDAIWVQPLTYEERGYDAVASYDWVDWSFPYPDSVNFGLSFGKKNAPFWRIFRDSMRHLHNDVHGFTGVMMPYKLLEKYPHLLKIDPHLQVICYQFRCHPTYVKDYHNMAKDHITSNSIPNWKKDVHAFHWTHPNPREYANETTLLASKGLFADIGRFVLKQAGLI